MASMSQFWSGRRVLVTGGNGFLGRVVVSALRDNGADVLAPPHDECDLTVPGAAESLFARTKPGHVIHLAARVGGIGYNQVDPARLYLDNLLMGTYVIEAARATGVEKTVLLGTVCSYPKFTPVPFKEESLWDGYPEETNAPYGIAKKARLSHPHQPLRPRRQVPPVGVARDPRAHQEVRRGEGGRRGPHRRVGHGLGQPRVPVRGGRRARHRDGGGVARRH
jgi:hypothetical protein